MDKNVLALTTHRNIQVWCDCIIKNIRLIDTEIDTLFNKIIKLEDHLFNSKSDINILLKKLLELRESIKNIEIDAKEFVNTISITDHKLNSTIGQTVLQVLSQMNILYQTTYNLATFKIKNITNSRVVDTNIFISITALLISFLAYFTTKA